MLKNILSIIKKPNVKTFLPNEPLLSDRPPSTDIPSTTAKRNNASQNKLIDKAIENQAIEGQAAKGQAAKGQAAEGQAAEGQANKDEAQKGEADTIRGESVEEENLNLQGEQTNKHLQKFLTLLLLSAALLQLDSHSKFLKPCAVLQVHNKEPIYPRPFLAEFLKVKLTSIRNRTKKAFAQKALKRSLTVPGLIIATKTATKTMLYNDTDKKEQGDNKENSSENDIPLSQYKRAKKSFSTAKAARSVPSASKSLSAAKTSSR
ncbi:hypothetical protein MBM_04185 [Drepanopeziza brunnea f. sp. 'multigermtubi' MB_m1]|uniref:Uncharacterized protein n=1 Tax=Marssonina brunnea f. sp. multigermtubi (strain MB_m1) TaxID=1072389 RepID=K1WXP8_MARBU|nr:uncharacterized protein MBM_04185 [Drepanopeziza brunnea f. sp. 'multigermtubi' MB_m1]EKD17816.1 hypothetical protein MBM_04185 [Drepanopeziza brunnea f. sp. 'multigermtubi' MB_m1]